MRCRNCKCNFCACFMVVAIATGTVLLMLKEPISLQSSRNGSKVIVARNKDSPFQEVLGWGSPDSLSDDKLVDDQERSRSPPLPTMSQGLPERLRLKLRPLQEQERLQHQQLRQAEIAELDQQDKVVVEQSQQQQRPFQTQLQQQQQQLQQKVKSLGGLDQLISEAEKQQKLDGAQGPVNDTIQGISSRLMTLESPSIAAAPSQPSATEVPDSLTPFRQKVPSDLRDINLDIMTETDLGLTAHSVFDNINVLCKRKLRMGSLLSGGWEVCDDPDVRPTAPCTVYSIGVNRDWSFDEDISKLYGCQVYAFDHSKGLKPHHRSSSVHFFDVGVSSYTHTDQKGFKLMTFGDIRKTLGHSNTKIDLIKIDVEGSEWDTLHQMVTTGQFTGIKQVLFEFHVQGITRTSLLPKLKDVQAFERLGYRKFHVNKNTNCSTWVQGFPVQRTLCYEVHYIFRNTDQ